MSDSHSISCMHDGKIEVKAYPNVIRKTLSGKISDDDIMYGDYEVKKQIEANLLHHSLYERCANINCQNRNCVLRAHPTGNIDADIMFVNKMPTEYETCLQTSCSDATGLFFSMIIGKLNINRSSIYCTDMIKCNVTNIDEKSLCSCIDSYFKKEICLVKPKLIICNGINLAKIISSRGIIVDLPESLEYGIVYNVTSFDGTPLKFVIIYNLNKVLEKTEDEYKKCKLYLWKQITNAFNSLRQEGNKA